MACVSYDATDDAIQIRVRIRGPDEHGSAGIPGYVCRAHHVGAAFARKGGLDAEGNSPLDVVRNRGIDHYPRGDLAGAM